MYHFCYFGRNGEGNDPCNKPGDGHVLGHIKMDPHGDHGKFFIMPYYMRASLQPLEGIISF